MTHDEAVEQLDALPEHTDNEIAHSQADMILIHYLFTNGAPEISDAWRRAKDRVGFWYA